MFRHFVIALNILTFLWAQIAFAASTDQMQQYNTFLKESGITQHPVAFKELLAKFGKDMPSDVRDQWSALVKENPDLMMPKIDAKKLLINGEDELQMNVNVNGDNLIVTTKKSQDVWANVVGTVGGKAISKNITITDLVNTSHEMYKFRGKLQAQKQTVLSYEVFKGMDFSLQARYLKFMRQKLADVERVQTAHSKLMHTNDAKSVFNMLFQQALMGEAYAFDANNCVVAGNIDGTFNSRGNCHSNAAQGPSNCSAGQLKCNPDFYGDDACVAGVTKADFANATANCNDVADPDLHKIVTKLTDSRDVFEQLKKTINQAGDACNAEPKGCSGPACTANKEDQAKACANLKKRRDIVRELFCSNHPGKPDAQVEAFAKLSADMIKKLQDLEKCGGPGAPGAPPAVGAAGGTDLPKCPAAADPANTNCPSAPLNCVDASGKPTSVKAYQDGFSDKGFKVDGGKCVAIVVPAPVPKECSQPQVSNSNCPTVCIQCPGNSCHAVFTGGAGADGWEIINHGTPDNPRFTCEQDSGDKAKSKKPKEEKSFWDTYGDDCILGGAIVGMIGLACWANHANMAAYRASVVGTTTSSTIVPTTTTTTPTAPTPGSYEVIHSVVAPGTR